MSDLREPVEELRIVYICESCGHINIHSFMTKHDETITNEDELLTVLESTPCRFCRLEKLKFKEKHIIIRPRFRG